MPTYEYECKKCNKVHSIFHSIKDKITQCPECGEPVERLCSGGLPPVFKGAGWTDKRSQSRAVYEAVDKGKRERDAALSASNGVNPYPDYNPDPID